MQHRDALQKVRSFFNRAAIDPTESPSSKVLGDDAALSGPTLLQQEPDLLKEAGRRTLDFSGWAAGGHPVD